MKNELKIKSRIWIEVGEETFLGNGRIQLLDIVHRTGSIKKAAKELKMSYKKAWSLLDSMNRQANEVYMIKSAGGSGGGGSVVTEAGINAIKKFNKLNKSCQEFINTEVKKLDF